MGSKIKVGMGYDAHRFSDNGSQSGIVLCGVNVPCKYSIIAHSDGDLALHALTDAILGAISAGDIGMHFPPSDPQWKNAKSDQFVKFAINLVREKGGMINNVDITLICETPKISPHKESLIKSLAQILEISEEDVSVKATTTEKMGFTGREEGIACQAIVCISI